jgi:predicted RNA binding protein YcfA (HicA-like mRNA interferase family)
VAPKQATHNQKSMIALLRSKGWALGKGTKHNVKMEKEGERPITLPMHGGRDYHPNLTSRILEEAGLKGNG